MSRVSDANKFYMVLLIVGMLLTPHVASARKLLASSQDGESSTELKTEHAQTGSASNEDKKNFIAYGGMGHYSGIGGFVGVGGLPIVHGGGVGGIGGIGGGIGKVGGLGGLGGGIAKGGAVGGGIGGSIP